MTTDAVRSRLLFWLFAGAIALAAAGGGAVTFFARRNVAARKGHPDTISPAQSETAGRATAPERPAPARGSTPAAPRGE